MPARTPKEEPKPLTPAEQRFVAEYLLDSNATQAYLRAFGPQASYAAAAAAASRLVKSVKVRREIRAAQADLRRRLRLDAAGVLRGIAELATSDVGDILDFTAEDGVPRLKPARQIPAHARRAIASVKVRRVVEREPVPDPETGRPAGTRAVPVDVIEFKLWDKPGAQERLAKHLGLFRELPPLETLLALLPPELAGPLRRALAESVQPGTNPGGAPGHGPEPGGPAGGPGAVLRGGGPGPGPVAEAVPLRPVEAADAAVLPPGGEELRGGGEDAGPLFDDG